MRATAACPALTQSPGLVTAYKNYTLKYDAAFEKATGESAEFPTNITNHSRVEKRSLVAA